MTMILQEALEEVKRVSRSWDEHILLPDDPTIATILDAAASGDLIPATDARPAVAEVLRMAGKAALDWWDGDDRDLPHTRILALADTDALAEVQALRSERDRWMARCIAVERDQGRLADMAEAAEAKIAQYETEDGMKGAIVHAIRLLLNSCNVPSATFIDDHVGNAIAQRDAAEAKIAALVNDVGRVVNLMETAGFGDSAIAVALASAMRIASK